MEYGNYRNKILKSTDSEFDFLGGCGIVFLLPPAIAMSYFGSRHLSKKYGKGGYSAIAESTTPTDIQVRAGWDCYEKLS